MYPDLAGFVSSNATNRPKNSGSGPAATAVRAARFSSSGSFPDGAKCVLEYRQATQGGTKHQ